MSDRAIIQADYCSFRTVAGRKVLQLVLEVPLEETPDVLAALGMPKPGESRWVAVALLESNGFAGENAGGARKTTPKPSSVIEAPETRHGAKPTPTNASIAEAGTSETRAHKPFASLPLSQQAALICGNHNFWAFLGTAYGRSSLGVADAAASLKDILAINSRGVLDSDHTAATRWKSLYAEYEAWQTTQKYGQAAR